MKPWGLPGDGICCMTITAESLRAAAIEADELHHRSRHVLVQAVRAASQAE